MRLLRDCLGLTTQLQSVDVPVGVYLEAVIGQRAGRLPPRMPDLISPCRRIAGGITCALQSPRRSRPYYRGAYC